jgi:hypothetical protein
MRGMSTRHMTALRRSRPPPSPPSQEVDTRQSEELHRASGSPDQNGPLVVGRLPQTDPQAGNRSLLNVCVRESGIPLINEFSLWNLY